MSNDEVRRAIDAVHVIQQLYQCPLSREEEEILHLMGLTLKRILKMHTGLRGDTYDGNTSQS